jgi:hypothetical protein
MSSEGFSALEKNAVLGPQRTVLPIQLGATARCRLKWPFDALLLNLNLLDQVWQPAADYNGCLARFKLKKMREKAITISSQLSHPTRSLSRIVCRWQEGSKDTLRPGFQANTWLMIFFSQCRFQKQEGGCKEI